MCIIYMIIYLIVFNKPRCTPPHPAHRTADLKLKFVLYTAPFTYHAFYSPLHSTLYTPVRCYSCKLPPVSLPARP